MRPQCQVEISFGFADDQRVIRLTGPSRDFFVALAKHPDVMGHEGEVLAEAIIKVATKGYPNGLYRIERFCNGKRNDSRNGDAALIKFNGQGNLLTMQHFSANKPQNNIRGLPAYQAFGLDGKRTKTYKAENGKLRPLNQDDIKRLNFYLLGERRKIEAAPLPRTLTFKT